jgi:hypothetical protein
VCRIFFLACNASAKIAICRVTEYIICSHGFLNHIVPDEELILQQMKCDNRSLTMGFIGLTLFFEEGGLKEQ